MNNVEQIMAAVLQLPSDEFGKFVEWLAELDQQRWNEQFERDMMAGRLDALAEEAIADYETKDSR